MSEKKAMWELVKWSDRLCIGVAEVDTQHQKLVSLLNNLHVAIREHHGSETSRKVLNELAEYTRVHFATEESLMRVSNYPGFDTHKPIHTELIQQVTALQEKVNTGNAKITFELLHFLKNWLTHHIVGADKEFGEYFVGNLAAARWATPREAPRASRKPWWKFW